MASRERTLTEAALVLDPLSPQRLRGGDSEPGGPAQRRTGVDLKCGSALFLNTAGELALAPSTTYAAGDVTLRDRIRRWRNPAKWRDEHPEVSDGEGFALGAEQRQIDAVEKSQILKTTDALGFEHKRQSDAA